MEEEEIKMTQKMSKIDINKDQKQADKVIQKALASQNVAVISKEKKAAVFKALTILKNKPRNEGGAVSLRELKKQASLSDFSEEDFKLALISLD